jgi:hypothetical protein
VERAIEPKQSWLNEQRVFEAPVPVWIRVNAFDGLSGFATPIGVVEAHASLGNQFSSEDSGWAANRKEQKMALKLLSTAFIATILFGCAADDYLMQKKEYFEQGDWVFDGVDCMLLARGSEDPRGPCPECSEEEYPPADNFINEHWHSSEGRIIIALSTSDHVEKLEFDREFLRSGDERVTALTTPSGTKHRYTHWGGPDCAYQSPEEE